MMNVPAEYLVFIGLSISQRWHCVFHSLLIHSWLVSSPDESGCCSQDLLRTFIWSKCGHKANWLIVDQKAKRFSILPGICYNRVLVLTVFQNTVKAKNFEHFIKYRLVCAYFWPFARVFSCPTCVPFFLFSCLGWTNTLPSTWS
jgi:hypothetical protein